jgi:hypothetical protein
MRDVIRQIGTNVFTKEFRQRRDALLHLGIVEHHLLRDRTLSVFDICERLIPIQDAVLELDGDVILDRSSVIRINNMVTRALGQRDGTFEREDEWQNLISGIEDGGGFDQDPAHASGWIFSSLYWDHLTLCQFASAWFFTNAIRAKYQIPPLQLAPHNLGQFLGSLSGSGPPINDGQTFFPDQYGS